MKEINNQSEIIELSNRTQNIFKSKKKIQKLKELEKEIEKLSLNLKDEDNTQENYQTLNKIKEKNFLKNNTQ